MKAKAVKTEKALGGMRESIKELDSNTLFLKFLDLLNSQFRGVGGAAIKEQVAIGQEEILRRMIAGHEDLPKNKKSKK